MQMPRMLSHHLAAWLLVLCACAVPVADATAAGPAEFIGEGIDPIDGKEFRRVRNQVPRPLPPRVAHAFAFELPQSIAPPVRLVPQFSPTPRAPPPAPPPLIRAPPPSSLA